MARYADRMLLPDEHVIYTTGLHWVVYRYGLSLLLYGALIEIYADPVITTVWGAAVARWVSLPVELFGNLLILAGAMQLFFALLRRASTEIVVTNQRVIAKSGVVAVRVYQTMVKKVTSVNIEQSVMGRIQGYGNVTVLASGGDLPEIDHVDDPLKLYHYVMGTSRDEYKAEIRELAAKPAIEHKEPPRLSSIQGGKRKG